MKNYIQKGISLTLVASMVVCGFSGCGTTKTTDNTDKTLGTVKETNNEANVEALLTGKLGDAKDTDKKETVYVEMNADGTVTKTTVSDVLKVKGKDNISDVSDLTDITNISGDEAFTTDNGKLIWENKGKDISYQGTTTKSAPIDIKVSYYLDDKEISPEDLAGKSGKVKIVYDYTNNSKEVAGNFVPFITLTGMILDDNFSNVTVDNGKVVDYDDNKIVVGYAAPGFKDHLLDTIDKAKDYISDIDIPESVTITADVKDFSMDMALTVATSELGDIDLKDTLDFSDIEGKMDELKDGTDELVNGATKLNNGANELKSGSSKINSGASDIAKYTSTLSDGTKELLGKYSIFNQSLLEALASADDGAGKLNKGAKDLSSGLATAKAAFEDTKKSQGLNNGAKALNKGAKEANAGVKQLAQTLQGTPSSIQTQIDGIIAKLNAATGGLISSEKVLNQIVEGINGAVTKGMDLNTVLTAKGLDVNTYYTLLQAYYSVQTLESVKSTFEAQISASVADIQKLLAGMDSLEAGTTSLSSGVTKLYSGIKQLNTGAATLAKGTADLKSGTGELKSKIGAASPQIKSGIGTVNSGASQISDGAKTLAAGTKTLDNGIVTLANGTKDLKDGTIKLNKEGISKITEIFGEDTKDAVNKIEDVLNAGKKYNSFSGINSDMSGDVKFIFKTAEIKSEK
ncbi:hypothetical protein [Eubacterium sp.]|uniref:hypothetical protein n=1 Tax=Eubacterium sp. TaxID=142586 RepID=UPI00351F9B87